MKPTFSFFAAASLLIRICMVQPASAAEPLPAWVVAEKEPLVVKKSSVPSYVEMTQTATIVRPKALTKIEELEKLTPGLTQVLPGLGDLVGKGTVSPKFKRLYDAKIESMKGGAFMSEHSYFDCTTVLNVRSEKSGRTAFVFQSDMETDTDGTDPVRLPSLKDYDDARLSHSFQPVLSYAWKKEADGPPNPFIKYYEDTMGQLRGLKKQVDAFAQADRGPIWQDMKKQFDEQIATLDRRANYYRGDLLRRRSLVGSLDPFIVVPTTWVGSEMSVGDFAAVVHAGHVYPCIIGDTGPKTKTGEASQKLAKALNPSASGRVSAVSTACVTYIVFPQTRIAKGAPDFARYATEVQQLIDDIGGLGPGVKLHAWQ
jgi:hypothetical protein